MRIAVLALLFSLPTSLVAGQARDGAAWIALAREATAGARYDTAWIDLGHAEEAPTTPELAHAIEDVRRELYAAETGRSVAREPREGWTHGLSLGLFGGAAFAAGTSVAFGVLAAISGFGKPPCGFDCTVGPAPDIFFGLSVASGVSMLALVSVAAWLAVDGRSLEDAPAIVPAASASSDGFWLGVSGLL